MVQIIHEPASNLVQINLSESKSIHFIKAASFDIYSLGILAYFGGQERGPGKRTEWYGFGFCGIVLEQLLVQVGMTMNDGGGG
jgi:hypothetical protein